MYTPNDTLNKFAGCPLGLSPAALRKHGKSHPAFAHLCAFIERAPQIMEQRRAIVRRMQIDNLFSTTQSKEITQ